MNIETKKRLLKNPLTSFGIYIIRYRCVIPFKRLRTDATIKKNRRNGMHNELLLQKDKHEGEACFIIGNGPSVRLNDLDRIQQSGIDSFGANRITDIFSSTTWRPKYMCVMDPGFLIGTGRTTDIETYLSVLEKEGIENVFFNSSMRKSIGENRQDSIVLIDVPGASLFRTNLAPFSDDASVYVSDLGSVTPFSIQIACYMGYKTIYLYGVDDAYTKYLGPDGAFHIDNEIESHVAGMRTNQDDEHADRVPRTQFEAFHMKGFADLRKNSLGYAVCKKYAEDQGITIENATHGGKLEAFDRIDFDEAVMRAVAINGEKNDSCDLAWC